MASKTDKAIFEMSSIHDILHAMSDQKTDIFVFGAGFGGLAAALAMEPRVRKDPTVRITLVDRHAYHFYTPLLYEVATAYALRETRSWAHALERGSTVSLASILAGKRIRLVKDTIQELSLHKKKVTLSTYGQHEFTYGIIALGSRVEDFHIPGVRAHGIPLKTIRDAVRIRHHVEQIIESLKKSGGAKTIIIGGGGYTGVELAAELYRQIRKLSRAHRIPTDRVRILILEGGNAILPGLDARARIAALRRLHDLGIALKLNHHISRVEANAVTIDDRQTFPCDLFIWTGGVSSSEVSGMESCARDPKHRLHVNSYLQVKKYETIFAIGDNACFEDAQTHQGIPMTAQIAERQGAVAGYNVVQHVYAKLMQEFHPHVRGMVVPLGGKYAVAAFGPFVLRGVFGWMVKKIVDLRYYLLVLPFKKAVRAWFTGARMFAKND